MTMNNVVDFVRELFHHQAADVSPPSGRTGVRCRRCRKKLGLETQRRQQQQRRNGDGDADGDEYCTCRQQQSTSSSSSPTCSEEGGCGRKCPFFNRNRSNNIIDDSSNGDSPPVHPVQSFDRICKRIERDDGILTCVDLSDEFVNVKKLASALSKNTHLRHLHLQRTIRDRETQDSRPRSAPAHDVLNLFMDGLRYNNGLVSIDLSQTCIRSSGALFVSRGLENHPTLERLRLNRCILQDEGIRRLGRAPLGRRLVVLDLSHNLLSDGTALLQLLKRNPHLEHLDLSANNLGSASLEKFLQDGFLSLRSLNLSRNNIRWDTPSNVLGRALGSTIFDADASLIPEDARSNVSSSIHEVAGDGIADNEDSGPTSNQSEVLQNSVHDSKTKLEIQLSSPADALRLPISCRLEELRLDCNMLTNAVAESISNGLVTNTSLRKLDLSQNCIGNKGAAALAFSISTNAHCKLRDLSLGNNKIASRGALALLFFACSSNDGRNDHPSGVEMQEVVQPSSTRPLSSDSIHDKSETSNVMKTILPFKNGLTHLDLSNNLISDGQSISNALQLAGTCNDCAFSDGTNRGESIQHVTAKLKKKMTKIFFEWNINAVDQEITAKKFLDPWHPSTLRYLNIHRNPISFQYKQEIRFWTRLNASGGRRLLSISGENSCTGEMLSQWARVLGDVSDDPNGIYFFLLRKPELCSFVHLTSG